jgi:hypothetical protein
MGWTDRFDLKRAGALLVASICVVGTANAGPVGGDAEGLVKRVATGDFFFVDVNADKTWTAADDAKFRIQGGALPLALTIVGDFNGNGQASVGVMDDQKYYVDADSNFVWAPGGGNELVNFFAPNVGMTHAIPGDFDGAGGDDPAKFAGGVTGGNFFYADRNGNKLWNGTPADAKFRIQGGTIDGVPFSCKCFGGNAVNGLMSDSKVYIDKNGDFAWTPAVVGAETAEFFAPNVGAVTQVLIGDWGNTGVEKIGKVAGGFIYLDLNGDFRFTAADDAKFRIQGGTLVGPHVAGDFNGDGSDIVGQVDPTKFFLDANGDGAWTPAAGDSATFFAPNQGAVVGAGAGVWTAP